MPVDTRHSEYAYHHTEWTEIRDAYAGEQAVKGKNQTYLPVPSGYDEGVTDARYQAYLKRARFPELVAPALRAIMGTLFRRPITVELPTKLSYIEQSATPEGLSLNELIQAIAEEVILTARVPIFVDRMDGSSLPYLNIAQAEQLINWRESFEDGQTKLTLAVIQSVFAEPDPDDPFMDKPYHEWLVLQLDEGRYVQRLYRKNENDTEPSEIATSEPALIGEAFDEIPLWVIGSTGTGIKHDVKPMLGIARLAVSIYQQYADYRQALYMSAQPTAVLTGVSRNDPDCPNTVGGGVLWVISNPDAKAEYLEFDGQGVEKQRQSIADDFDQALQLGAVMTTGTRKAAESGEALRIRQGVQTATLRSIVDAIEDGVNSAIRFAAKWVNANPDEVKVEMNRDFIEDRLSSSDITALVAAWQSGAFPRSILWNNLRRTEIIPQQMTDEDIAELMAEEGPSFSPSGMTIEQAVMRARTGDAVNTPESEIATEEVT